MPIGVQLARLQRGTSEARRDTPRRGPPPTMGRGAGGDEQGQGGRQIPLPG